MVRRSAVNPFSMTLAAGCGLLAASGAVTAPDITFSLAWPVYIAAINRFRFSSNRSMAGKPSRTLVPENWIKYYAAFAGLIALLIPAVLCTVGALHDGKESQIVIILGPHLYLTAAQVVCEFFSSGSNVAMLPRMLVPIGFNTYRMWTLCIWCNGAAAAGLGPSHMLLAYGNLAFWAYNLFVFLLLKMVPLYLNPEKAAT